VNRPNQATGGRILEGLEGIPGLERKIRKLLKGGAAQYAKGAVKNEVVRRRHLK
jgi:hypothetical protein